MQWLAQWMRLSPSVPWAMMRKPIMVFFRGFRRMVQF
jgi:hypothetical protein